jgi:hypothetical protein
MFHVRRSDASTIIVDIHRRLVQIYYLGSSGVLYGYCSDLDTCTSSRVETSDGLGDRRV